MLYFVECGFNDPLHEASWNDFYSNDKLPALISVPGFASSQRFHALRGDCPPYLAIHEIVAAEVLDSVAYREKGGGNFARWQAYITDWKRNVYAGAHAPLVGADECLLLCNAADSAAPYGLQCIDAVALDNNPAQRWLGKLPTAQAAEIPDDGRICIYRPLGDALISSV